MVGTLRRILKSVIKKDSATFVALSKVYSHVKTQIDYVVFKIRHPTVDYKRYNPAEIIELHRSGYFSQLGQDFFLTTEIFGEVNHGVFIDIGCNHPEIGSNSAYLEKLGWEGFAFDPLPIFEDLWKKQRSTVFIRAAISDAREEREFIEFSVKQGWEHLLSGFATSVREEDLDVLEHRRYSVMSGPLSAFCPDLTEVDIVMIDVEGAEREVITGLELERLKPTWILIENNRVIGGDETLRRLLADKSYDLVARISATDDLFARA